MSRPFHIVDVFAEERYTGNQLAVVWDAGDLSDSEMQRIAAEMDYSETTFIESATPTGEGYPVRIFTPETELPFAGHPTLGTASVLRERVLDSAEDGDGETDEPGDEIALSLGVGEVPVTIEGEGDDELFWMRQPDPSFGERVEPVLAARAVNLDEPDLDGEFAPRVVSTGLPTLVLACRSLAAVRRARIDDEHYRELIEASDAETVLVFCPETVESDNDLHVRVFAPVHGVPEDPATGSSNGCLAAYLARERFFGSPAIDVRVEQGYELDRPSLLYLRTEDAADGSGSEDVDGTGNEDESEDGSNGSDGSETAIDVYVGGRVIPVATGELL
jgi:trans-2,3-dihydro-3-hydroxyanthranilate isomerase